LGCVVCALSTTDCHASSEDPLLLLCFSKEKILCYVPIVTFFSSSLPLWFSIQNKNPFFFVRVKEIPERERERERERDTHTHTHRGRDRGDLLEWRIALPWGM
jgi:hypothetical protein